MKKTLIIIIAVMLSVSLFCSCSETVTVTADNGLEFTTEEFTITDNFENIIPETNGNQILAVKVLADKNSDPDLFADAFNGESPSVASDGTNTYECKAVAYGESDDSAVIIALYEIPAGMQKTVFTISGPFSSFSGTVK